MKKTVAAIKNCFSPERVNLGRQPELDVAKGLAIVFMVWVHAFEELSPDAAGILETIVIDILGGPFAAPVFMICVGVGLCYSQKGAPRDLLYRGLSLLGVGLMLNTLRFGLPYLIMFAMTGRYYYLEIVYTLFSVDILQFAGMAFLFFALAKKLALNKWAILLIGAAASVLGMALRGVSLGSYEIDQFVGFFWGTDTETWFPFLNWIIFPAAGLFFGSFLIRCKDKKSFYTRLSLLCGGLTVIYLILSACYGMMFLSDGAYYFLGPLDAAFFIILALALFGLYDMMARLMPERPLALLTRLSRNIMQIYCIHWVLLGMLWMIQQLFAASYDLRFWQVTLIAALLLVISDRLAVLYVDKIKPVTVRM